MSRTRPPLKLLILTEVGNIGGAEQVILSHLRALQPLTQMEPPPLTIHVLALAPGPLIEAIASLGGPKIQILPLPDPLRTWGDSHLQAPALGSRLGPWLALIPRGLRTLPHLFPFLARLRRTLITLAPDLIHTHSIKTHLLTALVAPAHPRLLWHFHDFYPRRPLASRLLGALHRRAHLGLAVSNAVAHQNQTVLPHLTILPCPNTVDIHRFTPSQRPEPPQVQTIGLVATFAHWKGHRIFLEAAAQLLQAQPNPHLRFCIVGGPIYATQGSQVTLEALQTLAQERAIAPQVEFWGYQTDMVPIYQRLDIVVHASTEPEPFGLTILEAMACGRPIIAVAAGGTPEIFTPDQDALAIPPNDIPALCSALARLLGDHPLRQSLAHQARRTASTRFHQGNLGAHLLHYYYGGEVEPHPPIGSGHGANL